MAVKGGVYGVTRGLRDRFGSARVFDTLLDEQTVLGTALGTSLAGFVPVPEIQYLAYLHNAEDQLRGEAASLPFFSDGQYRNGMVVRIPGLAYQKGFGGHFHNDNSLAVLRDIPGIAVAVASHPHSAPGLLRGCLDLAREGRVCVYVEPIARYHTRDLFDGDGGWLAPFDGSDASRPRRRGGLRHRAGPAHRDVRQRGLHEPPGGRDTACGRLRLHSPRPGVGGAAPGRGAGGGGRSRVRQSWWWTRRGSSGGVSEAVVTALVDAGVEAPISRVTSADSFIPLGPAADAVLLQEKRSGRSAA